MPQKSIRYLLLQFSPNQHSQAFRLLLAESCSGGPLEITLPAFWEHTVDPRDQEYLSELIRDWQNTPPQASAELFKELAQLSHGPLRVVDANLASSDHYLLLRRTITAQSNYE